MKKPSPGSAIVRPAVESDAESMTLIYNHYVQNSNVTWTETDQSVEERLAWMQTQWSQSFPILVLENDASVAGFASYGWFRGEGKWPGYRRTVEHSVYVGPHSHGLGFGQQLLANLLTIASQADIHVMVGGIDADNEGSIRFHQKMGFREVARMPEVGFKFGKWRDLLLFQRQIGESPAPGASNESTD